MKEFEHIHGHLPPEGSRRVREQTLSEDEQFVEMVENLTSMSEAGYSQQQIIDYAERHYGHLLMEDQQELDPAA